MTSPLTESLRKALAFDYSTSRIAYQKHEWPMNKTLSQHSYWTEGQAQESIRLAPIHECLIECVEFLTDLVHTDENGVWKPIPQFECDALTKLKLALEGG